MTAIHLASACPERRLSFSSHKAVTLRTSRRYRRDSYMKGHLRGRMSERPGLPSGWTRRNVSIPAVCVAAGMDINLTAGDPKSQGPVVMDYAQSADQLEGLDEADMEWVVHALLAYTEEGEEEGLNESTCTNHADVCEAHDTRRAAECRTSATLSSEQTHYGSVLASARMHQRKSTRVDKKQAREQRRRRELNDSFNELVQVLSDVEAGEGLLPGGDKSWSDLPKGKRSAFRVAVLCRTVYAIRYMRQAKKALRQNIRRLSLRLDSLGVTAEQEGPELTKAHVCGGSLCTFCSKPPWQSVDK